MQFNVNSSSPFFYVDCNQTVQIDNNHSYLGWFRRAFTSKLGYRNYDILEVLKAAVSKQNLRDNKRQMICEKVGKKLGIKTEYITQLFKVLTLGQKEDKNSYETELHHLTSYFANPPKAFDKTEKSLKQLSKHFEKNTSASQVLSSVIEETSLKFKCKTLGIDEHLVEKYSEDIKFLIKTRLIYSIIGFQNTTSEGPGKHQLQERVDENGIIGLYIRKQVKTEGNQRIEWVSLKKIQEELQWDNYETALTSKNNPYERWNYFGEGLVPIDRFYHHEVAQEADYPHQNAQLHPVVQLSPEEMKDVLNRAKNFTNFNAINNPQTPKEELTCVIQFVSNPRPPFQNKLLQNINAQLRAHCGIRIIMSDGSVYSTAFGSTPQEYAYRQGTSKCLGTTNAQPTIMDYEEFRPHEGRIVTNIPIGNEKAKEILKDLNDYRKRTSRFNLLKQNCMRLGTHVLSMTGVDLNIRLTFNTLLYRALPNLPKLASIPVIGKHLQTLRGRVEKIADITASKVPTVVKKIFHLLGRIFFFVPHHLGVLIRNLFVLSLGGLVASPIRENQKIAKQEDLENLQDTEERDSLETFSKLSTGLFDENALDIQHSSIFINWQLQQPSTDVYRYTGRPNMNIVPPTTKEAKAYSEKRKQEFKEIYQYSTPMYV